MKKCFLILAALFCFCMTLTAKPKVSESTKATLQQCAKLTQAMVPMNVDEVTIFWGINSEEDTLIYYYAIKYNSSDFEDGVLAAALKPTLVETVKKSTDQTILTLKKLNTTFEHRYYGNDGQLICAIKVTPEDYSK